MAPVCNFVATGQRCRYGAHCRFSHDVGHESRNAQPREGKNEKQEELTVEQQVLKDWNNGLRQTNSSVKTSKRVSQFFDAAALLVEVSVGSRQEVVRSLATQEGFLRIQLAISQTYSYGEPALPASKVFSEQVLPLFKILTHPDVVLSSILEIEIERVGQLLAGSNGDRFAKLLKWIAEALENPTAALADGAELDKALNHTLKIIQLVVDGSQGASGNNDVQALVTRIGNVLVPRITGVALCSTEAHEAGLILTRVQKRMDIALSLPTVTSIPKPPTVKKAKFKIEVPPPGGRHSNDHEHIEDIEILPMPDEIASIQPEYLPVKDLSDNHHQGLDGLLDRSFRLLREDTVGQLRDAVRSAIQRMTSPNGTGLNGGVRTYTYNKVRFSSFDFDLRRGLSLSVSFDQVLKNANTAKLKEWWTKMKRLESEALVCLVDSDGDILFCTVHYELKPFAQGVKPFNDNFHQHRFGELFRDKNRAHVVLHLADLSEEALTPLLKWTSSRHKPANIALVEFPGVLLPAFKPTLLALQTIKVKSEIAMSEFLIPYGAPNGEVMEVPAPDYATAAGFRFNLKCLTDDNSDLFLAPGQPFDVQQIKDRTTLDDAQAVALQHGLIRKLALIQGPPGTGKSYIGVALTRVLLANKKTAANKVSADIGPIIVVSFSNHACDQFLEHLHGAGVEPIIRIGSRSKSEILKGSNLRDASKGVQRTNAEKTTLHSHHVVRDSLQEEIEGLAEKLNNMGVGLFVKYLRKEHPQWCQRIFGIGGEDKEGWVQTQSKDKNKVKSRWIAAGGPSMRPPRNFYELFNGDEVGMSTEERQQLYDGLLVMHQEDLAGQLSGQLQEYMNNELGFRQVTDDNDKRALQEAQVIGVTTSGLARNLHLLRKLQAKVLICEEAGEVLEPHILTSLLPSIQHVIMIGDHLQLRPQVQNYDLSSENRRGEQFSLDISLFERLIHPDEGLIRLPYDTLASQRRMHPSISRLVRQTLYPDLLDAGNVANYPEVVGMRKRLFWLDHRKNESSKSQEDQQTSHWNEWEVDMSTALVRHLIAQGAYEPTDIAILTPYLGQLQKLRQALGKENAIVLSDRDLDALENAGVVVAPNTTTATEVSGNDDKIVSKTTLLKALRIATIDNFQGEEAKVIVLSLVRSNKAKKCGFLKTSNRINVALSRAQHGMYIIGDSDTASAKVDMWTDVVGMLANDGNLNDKLELQCPRHPETPIVVSEPDDFLRFSPAGGCDLPCADRLECGHACTARCHSEVLHKAVHCLEECPRPLKGCDHACPNVCGDPCPERCQVNIYDPTRMLPCGHHAANLPCWRMQDDLARYPCPILVPRTIPGCGHVVQVECHVDVAAVDFQCTAPCLNTLPCGHVCRKSCCTCTKRGDAKEGGLKFEVDHGKCKTICGRAYTTCSHTCAQDCHGDKNCEPCKAPCETSCAHSRCVRKCSQPCQPCAEEKCFLGCPHSKCTLPCAVPCNNLPCSKRCMLKLRCGHQCPSVCGEVCPDEKFCQVCGGDEVLDRAADLLMFAAYRDVDLDTSPCLFPPCGHFYTVETMDGTMAMATYYNQDQDGTIVDFKPDSMVPFEKDEFKACADCRGSLRNLKRYGRILRRHAIDEASKRFIVWANAKYVPLALKLEEMKDLLASYKPMDSIKASARSIKLSSDPEEAIKDIPRVFGKYYSVVIQLRAKIAAYHDSVKKEEQPFQKIVDLVENARRRQGTQSDFKQVPTLVQTNLTLRGRSLLMRCDLLIIGDVMKLRQLHLGASDAPVAVPVDFSQARRACLDLVGEANANGQVLRAAEGHLYFAQYVAFERLWPNKASNRNTLLKEAQIGLAAVKKLIEDHEGSTAPIQKELGGVERMLAGGVFYAPVSNEEMKAVVQAMAQELRGTGHWYYCENRHPFTIGECGMPMEQARCPQCGASVGGRNHTAVTGVTAARDLEQNLRDMHL